MNRLSSTLAAFFIAPLVPAVACALLTPISRGPINTDVVSVLELTPAFYCFSIAASTSLGGPLFLLFNHYNLVRWWSALLCGMLVGVILSALFRQPGAVHARDFLLIVPLSALSALVFWAIWRRGNLSS